MKKLAVLIIFVFVCLGATAQHEGIRRYFSSYTLNNDTIANYTVYNDSTIDYFYKFMPQQKVSDNTLGLLSPGNPYITALFSKSSPKSDFSFLNNYYAFIKTHDDVVYYDAQKPFSRFDFVGGAKGLEMLKFILTQNFGPYFNLAVDYELANSEGFYLNNASKTNALSVSGAFTKKKYQNHFNFIFNKINCNENAGIADMNMFESGIIRAVDNNVLLTKAVNNISQLGFQYNHEYRFGKYSSDTIIREAEKDTVINKTLRTKFSIVHDITFDRFFRKYTDEASNFYANYYINENQTNDSASQLQLVNKLLLCLNLSNDSTNNSFKLYAGLRNNMLRFGIDSTYKKNYNTTYLTGNLFFKHGKTNLYAEANYALFGAYAFDFDASAKLRQMFGENFGMNAKVGYSLKEATPMETFYYSNNFQWENDFDKSGVVTVHADVFLNNISFSAGVNFNLLHNYIIFNQEALPQQINKANIVADVYANKTFNFWKFHWFTEVAYQYISDKEYVRLPDFVAYSSLFFKTDMFKNALVLQIGIDAKFNTNFYGYAYMPATGVFYLQDDRKVGNYPNLGAFLGAKIKRFRIFGRLSNWNSSFMAPTFFSLYRLPDNPLAFNFGISWEFYD